MNLSLPLRASRAWCPLLLCACLLPAVHAATVEHALSPLGGDAWQAQYTVVNTAGSPAFDGFSVYFDLPDTLEIVSFLAPAGWDALRVQVDPNLPDAGYFDAKQQAGPLAADARVAGFSVNFRTAAGVAPGAQRYELYLSEPFAVVASGITSAVPEPGQAALLLAGLVVLGWAARRPGQATGEHA